ncbi:MAG: cysteine desulfurase NifS [Candidatus Vogelbacteria bacterium CG10_big_fil_rev_8_21_14_0_10_49_38]|uniref:Cysteine desulfurase NifS n=1 Tax=Candidatus Vogelbacteria bacterium CG10_big_fil_rev_8_21_14_0_10_49_38 TaxID=1975043 RepID=A0A2H0RGV6_9BACT|nr:MAG: hypothetical protein BK006_03370 [bacterium CG10_49_38]PIR45782.1 MAG: cysteine desulfurase NifS [Candidatus Vogelbacteria bacterium CG10_big_fil_rev_8_21_14_0_10_49_38]
MVKKIKRIYWDTAAATPLAPVVFRAIKAYDEEYFGNPSSLHWEGVKAKRAVEKARAKIAKTLQAHPDEIVFTGSGTESNNLALTGVMLPATELITTAIEHPAVLEPARQLARLGHRVVYISVNGEGQIDLTTFKQALNAKTRLVSVMLANNEIGAVQPIRELAKIIRQHRKKHQTLRPYLHTDACQAPRFLELNVAQLGVDLLSFNGSKIYGPKGVAALYVRRGVPLLPLIRGGGQEAGRRSGTLNVAGIVGLAEALALCAESRAQENQRLVKVRGRLLAKLQKIPNLTINGGMRERLPHNLNFSVAGLSAEQLVLELDAKGIAVSAGSACAHDHEEDSATIMAISGNDRTRALGAVRVSLGRDATIAQADYFGKMLLQIIAKYQNYQTPGV